MELGIQLLVILGICGLLQGVKQISTVTGSHMQPPHCRLDAVSLHQPFHIQQVTPLNLLTIKMSSWYNESHYVTLWVGQGLGRLYEQLSH